MLYNWKAYLARKKQSLKDVVEHYQIKNYEKLKSLFSKQGLTSPSKKEFESAKESIEPDPDTPAEVKSKPGPDTPAEVKSKPAASANLQDQQLETPAENPVTKNPKPKRQTRRKRKQDGNAKIDKG